ncbi:MAG: hypothetical protein JWO60_2143, partial [Frankiales bacterium]|nr:hypothetical protein [Frankiales bacterium]
MPCGRTRCAAAATAPELLSDPLAAAYVALVLRLARLDPGRVETLLPLPAEAPTWEALARDADGLLRDLGDPASARERWVHAQL